MDSLTKKQRSFCMSHIRSRNTAPELKFRNYLRKKGLKNYRVKNNIRGKPDIYFPKKKIAVFIDGCFWHKCPKCFVGPKTKKTYWMKKIKRNIERDKEINSILKKNKIKVLRIWEHEINKNIEKCYLKLKKIYEKRV